LVTSAELTPIRIILGHCTPVLLVCPSTGGEDPAGQDRPDYELLRTIYGHSIWVWRQLNRTACSEQNSLADTRGNGYVADKLQMMMIASEKDSRLSIEESRSHRITLDR